MKLRYFSMCDKLGNWTQPELQYWDKSQEMWLPIPIVTCKTWEERANLYNKEAV